MPDPAARSLSSERFRAFWRSFANHAGAKLWVAVALLIVVGLLEGSGLLMLVPLLHALGLGGTGELRGAARSLATVLTASGTSLPAVLALFVAIKIAQAVLRAVSGMLNLQLQTEYVGFLRTRFYEAMTQADWLFLTRQRSSDLASIVLTELPMVGVAAQQTLTLLSVVIVASAHVAIAFTLSPSMAAFALGSGAIVGFGLRGLRRRSRALGELSQRKRDELAAGVTEHLSGMKVAKSHAREHQHTAHFRRVLTEINTQLMQVHRLGVLIGIWLEVGAVVALSLFVYFAVPRVNTAQLLVLVFVFTRLLTHSSTLQNLWHQIVQGLPSFLAAEKMREQLVAAAEPPAFAPVRLELRHAIALENISFRYGPHAADALRDIHFEIPARRITAVCGPSGAGKSTLADLLLGLLTPNSGRVLIDGVELTGPTVHGWRQSIGYVPQETFLFHESVRANLLWAQPEATEQDLRTALRAAAAEEFVDRLPQGIDTIVGDRGLRLSGGERQRLALARALLRRPTLLVLDEATSALDTQNERLVQSAIEGLQGELTVVVIAHRLSTVRIADRIVVLRQGEVAESGTWDDLRGRDQGLFQQLIAADTKA